MHSSASGEVTFVGSVAGTLYVVVRATNGVLVTHGRLASAQVSAGDRVSAGFRIGTSSGGLTSGSGDLAHIWIQRPAWLQQKTQAG